MSRKNSCRFAAVENGEIAKTRHESYVKLYESVRKDLKEWELTKGGTLIFAAAPETDYGYIRAFLREHPDALVACVERRPAACGRSVCTRIS